jgi:TonB family protein
VQNSAHAVQGTVPGNFSRPETVSTFSYTEGLPHGSFQEASMRQAPAVFVLFSSLLFGQSSPPKSASPQTARQALIDMFFGETPDHMERHLPEATKKSLAKFGGTSGRNYFSDFALLSSQIRQEGNQLSTFDTGPILISAEDPRPGADNGPDKIELTVERDDLIGDEDQIELALHLSRNGKEQDLPVIPRFTFSMGTEENVWKLNEITLTVRIPLGDPEFLKAMENKQRGQNEMSSMAMLRAVDSAEKNYSSTKGRYACSLSALGSEYLYDPELAKGSRNGYNFVISSCDTGHFKAVAEPAVADSGERAFCSDETGEVRAASDGKATTCLSDGEPVAQEAGEIPSGAPAVSAERLSTPEGGRAASVIPAQPKQSPAVKTTFSPCLQGQSIITPADSAHRAHAGPARAGESASPAATRVRVSEGVARGLLCGDLPPAVYPLEAKKAGVQGAVVLGAVIGKDGSVRILKALHSPSPLLSEAAIDAVKRWRYQPYILNGTPVEVDTTVTVKFTLPR